MPPSPVPMELDARQLVVDRRSGDGRAPVRVLHGIDLRIEAGGCTAIMGASGSGKTTLVLALGGLVPLTSGQVSGSAAGSVRMVLQRPEASFLEATVVEEVALAARHRGASESAANAAAGAALQRLGLPDGIGPVDPLALSGGEQRRVAIAAVLASDPRVIVLDEPSAGLDAAARQDLHAAIRDLLAAGRTVLLVTHDPAEAALLASRLVVLEAGRIAWDGAPAPILGDPERAAELGLRVTPEVRALHAAADARGVDLGGSAPADPAAALAALAELLTSVPIVSPTRARPGSAAVGSARPAARAQQPAVEPLPPAIDARVRLLATAAVVVAALVADSVLVVGAIVVATCVVLAGARVEGRRIRAATRPVVALGVALVLLQLLFGQATEVELWPGHAVTSGVLAAVVRILQVLAIVVATLVLTVRTSTVDLAAAIARLGAPLRLLRVPVDELALVTSIGLGFVPVLADELDRLRLAQAARGIGLGVRGPLTRLRASAMLLVPLFVLAFRRAQQLAEALTVRGYDPRRARTEWRERGTPSLDVVLLCSGMLLLGAASIL
ncbi:MAG: transporter related protein [Thermoleophilia bacterium]|nr:transporter related protein [Thermoleophilia bacterium]